MSPGEDHDHILGSKLTQCRTLSEIGCEETNTHDDSRHEDTH